MGAKEYVSVCVCAYVFVCEVCPMMHFKKKKNWCAKMTDHSANMLRC